MSTILSDEQMRQLVELTADLVEEKVRKGPLMRAVMQAQAEAGATAAMVQVLLSRAWKTSAEVAAVFSQFAYHRYLAAVSAKAFPELSAAQQEKAVRELDKLRSRLTPPGSPAQGALTPEELADLLAEFEGQQVH